LKRSWAQNGTLTIASVLVSYLVLELFVFPRLVMSTPLRLQEHLGMGVRILAQSSKRSALPHDYIALAGDSYAQGLGDWLLSVDDRFNPPFHSAHLLHEALGRDVVSFARGGAGSLRLAMDPVAQLAWFARSIRFRAKPPRDLWIYFYEGNDLQDTLFELWGTGFAPEFMGSSRTLGTFASHPSSQAARWATAVRRDARLQNTATYRDFIRDELLPEHAVVEAAASWRRELPLAGFVVSVLRRALEPEKGPTPLERLPSALPARNAVNLSGAERVIETEVQGPPLVLTPSEIDTALHVFGLSLGLLVESLPDSRICVAYIPSPATTYVKHTNALTLQRLGVRKHRFDRDQIEAASTELRARIRSIATQAGVAHLDTTPAIQRAVGAGFAHGPIDWNHLNRRGYVALAEAVRGGCGSRGESRLD
jgi:hypothetical protein